MNPIADISKYLPSAGSNYAQFEDAELEAIYNELVPVTLPSEELAALREAGSGRSRVSVHHAVVVQDRPVPFLREGLEDHRATT